MNFWIAGLLVLLSISPPLASAQSAEQQDEDNLFGGAEQDAARVAFKDGRIAFESGRYAEALERFEHAYTLSGKSELLYNIGLAADRIREDDRALEAFEQYLRETPSSRQREQVRMRVVAARGASSPRA
jgi:tetratricopeptide (TPR) repeat protein